MQKRVSHWHFLMFLTGALIGLVLSGLLYSCTPEERVVYLAGKLQADNSCNPDDASVLDASEDTSEPEASVEASADAEAPEASPDAGSPLDPSRWVASWYAPRDGLTLPVGFILTGSPVSLDTHGIRGGTTAKTSVALGNSFRGPTSLAALAHSDFTIVTRVRRFSVANPAALFGFGASNAGLAGTTYLEGRLARGTGNTPEVAQRATGSSEVLLPGTASGTSFADHVVAFTHLTSGTTTTWQDGATIASTELGAAPAGIDLFTIFGSPRGTTALYDAFDGYVQFFGISDRVYSPAELTTVDVALRASDLWPKGSCPIALFMGDSLTIAAQDRNATGQGMFGGIRWRTWEAARFEGLCWESIGTQNGGYFQEPYHGARSAFGVSSVATQLETELANPNIAARVRIVSLWVGAGDFVAIANTPSLLPIKIASYRTLLERALVLAPSATLVVSTVTPWNPTVLGSGSCDPWNAALRVMVNDFNTAHPTRQAPLVETFAAVGGAWNNSWAFDDAHPGPLGFDLVSPGFWTAMRPAIAAAQP